MALAKEFERQLGRVVDRRVSRIWRLVGLGGAGRRPADRGPGVRRELSRLMELAEALSFRHIGRPALAECVGERRRWSLRRRNLRGWEAKRECFSAWYRSEIAAQTCVYVAWAGRRCLYVGRSEIAHHRPRSHFEKAWFRRVTHIDIFVPAARRRDIVRLECLLTHAHGPSEARQRPAHKRHTSRCPVCTSYWRVRQHLRRALGMR